MGKINHTILLGSIGGDSHSVGIMIIKAALEAKGYNVKFLGSHNTLNDFFDYAQYVNIVMISCLDGHASRYLSEFPKMKQQFSNISDPPLWYLGGNLTIGDSIGYERRYYEMGFKRVYVKHIDIRIILDKINKDLLGVKPKEINQDFWDKMIRDQSLSQDIVDDNKIENQKIFDSRKNILQHWKTGKDAISLEKNAEFLIKQPSFSRIQQKVNDGLKNILVQPRSGVALVDDQIRLFDSFKKAGANVLSYQVDSLTRNNNYLMAEEAIKDGITTGISDLNGFPVINHGVNSLRKIITKINVPIQVRHSTRDPRLLAELSYAGGVTAFEGGSICYNIPYYKDYRLSESIKNWQYVDRLTGIYYDQYGIVIDREFFGVLTGTLVPPCIAIITSLLETILAVQQGVKCVSLGYAEQGNRIQDIAAIKVMKNFTLDILSNMGFKDIQVNTVFHQYMAGFPTIPKSSESLIYNSAITAKLSGATRILIKTPVESYKIPTMLDNIEAINLVLKGINNAKDHSIDKEALMRECEIINQEVESIFNSIIFLGKGKIVDGIIKGFQKGLIDVPFSGSIYNAGKVVTARDCNGAVRFVSCGKS